MSTKNDKLKAKKAKAVAKKDKMKAKMAAKKTKVGKAAKVVAVLALALSIVGCGSLPKSRSNDSKVGDQEASVKVYIADRAYSNSVYVVQHNTTGDVGYQAADSTGSNETMTANPTWTFPIKVDARYNDMLSQATDATKSTLSTIGSGLGAVLDKMLSGESGTVKVTKSDGTAASVECEGGQCHYTTKDEADL